MTKDEALRLALEALESGEKMQNGRLVWIEHDTSLVKQAITAIKAALEAKDEPVALAWAEGYRMGIADERTSEANIGIAGFNAKVEPARENPYVTTPPQRTWVGLTRDEILEARWHNKSSYKLARVLEAKLKEKNT
jgi:hypothetical protein